MESTIFFYRLAILLSISLPGWACRRRPAAPSSGACSRWPWCWRPPAVPRAAPGGPGRTAPPTPRHGRCSSPPSPTVKWQCHRNICTGQSCMGRRIYTEEKAKVVAAVRGTEFNQFLFAPAILHQDDLNNRINSSFSSYHPGAIHPFLLIILVQNILFFISSWWKTPSAASNWINSVPQIAATTFAFSSVFILLLWVYCI